MFGILEEDKTVGNSVEISAVGKAGTVHRAEPEHSSGAALSKRRLAGKTESQRTQSQRTQTRARYPVNLLESEIGEEVSELLSHHSLQLTSGHQAWLLMAIMYLVERERRKALNVPKGSVDRVFALARSEAN